METVSDDGSSPVCASSSATMGSPLWPQSFGRTMDLYSRSQRSEDGAGPLENEANIASESGSTPSTEARKEFQESREPLLEKYDSCQREDVTDDPGESGEQGSSFFQALFNGMKTSLQIRSYPDVGEAAFGKWGRWITSVLLYLELYAVAIEFLILEGDNLAHLFPSAGITVGAMVLNPHEVFVILAAVCMLPTVWLRELSVLSYVSATGVVASFLIVMTVGWIGLLEGVGFHHQGSLVHLEGLPVAVGLFSFCYCGHAVFPSIYGSMRNRSQFSHVLVICFVLCTIMYGGIAVMGYAMFGDELQSQITLNLPPELPASHVAIWVTLVNPFAKYAITLTPVAVALEELLPRSMTMASSSKDARFWGTVVRTLLVTSTVVVALAVPFFGLLMAFIGSFLSATVSIILPCLCYLHIFQHQLSRGEVLFVASVLGLGLVVGVGGTFFSVKAIIHSFLGLERVGLFRPL